MPRNLPAARHPLWLPPRLDTLSRWAAAFGVLLAAVALQLTLPRAGGFPFLALFPAIPLCAWVAGLIPALAVAGAAASVSWWFLMRPPDVLDWPGPAQGGALLLFLCGSVLTAALVDGLCRSALNARRDYARAKASVEAELARSAELHHRTANILQLISAAMAHSMQGDGGSAEAVRDAARRLNALGLYNRRLLAVATQASPSDALAELTRAQLAACGPGHVAVRLDLQPDLRIDPPRLVTLAAIISEAMCNALKHAFPQARPGHILIRLHRAELAEVELEIRDDGVGLPDGREPGGQQTAGLSIMRSLAGQLGGTLAFAPTAHGTALRVVFPEQDPAGGT